MDVTFESILIKTAFFMEHTRTGKQQPLLNALMKRFLKCNHLLQESIA